MHCSLSLAHQPPLTFVPDVAVIAVCYFSSMCSDILEFGNPLYSDDPNDPPPEEPTAMEAADIEGTIKEATTEI